MILCGIDLETTGLDTEALHVTEVAAYLFDVRKLRTVESFTTLVRLPAGVTVPLDCQELSNLDDQLLFDHGEEAKPTFNKVFGMMAVSDACVAHNATHFERKILENNAKRYELNYPGSRPWIDTAVDVEWGPTIKGKSLGHLAADHGFLNPFPHEAGPDVLTMLRLLSKYNIAEVLENAMAPKVVIQAVVSYDHRDKAKAAGFYWDPKSSKWLRTMRLDRAQASAFDFKTVLLGEAKP